MESNVTIDFEQWVEAPPRLTSFLKLTGLELIAPHDEETRVMLRQTWEPVSYRYDGGENVEVVSIPLTFRLTEEQIALYNNAGIMALPHGGRENRIAMDFAKDDKRVKFPFERWRRAFKACGFPFTYNAQTGVMANALGHVFECERFSDEFPAGNNESYTKFMIYPRKLADDYTPPAELPTLVRPERAVIEEVASAVTNGVRNGPSAEQIADAFVTAGIVGKPASNFAESGQQIQACVAGMMNAPVLGTAEVQDAAQRGQLIEYAVEKGAVKVEDGLLVRA